MLTPSEIQDKQFKSGLGFDKKDVEQFLHDLSSDFDNLQKENEDLKKKLKASEESLVYYRSIEKTLQKALILAEKTAQDTRATALREADSIQAEAKANAGQVLTDAKKQKEFLEHKIMNLMQQYDVFKIHFENLLHAQLELLHSKSFSVNTEDFSYKENLENPKQASSEPVNADQLQSSLTSVSDISASSDEPEDMDQIHFDFLDDSSNKSYQTEDGFEFFNNTVL